MKEFSLRTACLPAAILAAGPPLLLLATIVVGSEGYAAVISGSTARLGTLFLRSAGLGALTAVLAVILGAGTALWLAGRSGIARTIALAVLPLPLVLPRPVLALAAAGLLGPAAPSGGFAALVLSSIVLAAAWFPVVTLVTLLDLETLPSPALEAASLSADPDGVWFRGILPGLFPALVASGAFVACAAVIDYGVPATFQLPVWATELYSEFSLSGDSGRVAVLSLPLLFLAAAVLPLIARAVRRLPGSGRELRSAVLPARPSVLRRAVVLPAVAALAVPPAVVMVLCSTAGSVAIVREALYDGSGAILSSALFAGTAALLATACASLAAFHLLRSPSTFALGLCLLPAVLPAPLYGLGALAALRYLPAFPALAVALAGRFLPFSLVALLLLLRRSRPDLLDATALVPHPVRRLRLGLRSALPPLIAATAVTAALAFGDLGVTVLLAPPGADPFSVKLFNLLHFGAGDAAAGLALAALPLPLAAWGTAAFTAWRTG